MLNVMDFIGRLKRRLPLLFSEVWFSYGEPDKQEKMHYYVRTQQDRYNPYLRCSSRFIDPVEDVTVDWDKPLEGQGIGGLLERVTIAQGKQIMDDMEITESKPQISEKDRLEFAAIAWTFPETSHIEMDVILAKAFAEVIDIIVNGGFDTVDSYVHFKEAMDEQELKPQPEGK